MDDQQYQQAVQLQRQRMAQRTPEQIAAWSANREPTRQELDSHVQQTLLNTAQPVGTQILTMPCVYIMSNPTIPGLLKIGFTADTAEERCRQLSASTSCAQPFFVEWYLECQTADAAYNVEQAVHKNFHQYRYNRAREFFTIDLTTAIVTIERIAYQKNAVAFPDFELIQRLRKEDEAREAAEREAEKQRAQREVAKRIERERIDAEQEAKFKREQAQAESRARYEATQQAEWIGMAAIVCVLCGLFPLAIFLGLLCWWWHPKKS